MLRKRRIEEGILQTLENLGKKVKDCFDLVQDQLRQMAKSQETSFSSLEQKIQEFSSIIKGEERKLEELRELIQSLKPRGGVFLLVDGDYVLKRLYDLERRISWSTLLNQITENYGEIVATFFFAVFINPKFSLFLKRAGMIVVDTSTVLGEKGITDETILNFLHRIIPSGSTVLLFTGDRQLKRSANLIANQKRIHLEILDFDPEFPHPVKDSQRKIEVFLSFPTIFSSERTSTSQPWKDTLNRFLEGKFVNPEKEERDRIFLKALHYLFHLLPSFPKPIGSVIYPRGFFQLVGDLLSFFHCLENFKETRLSLSEVDAIGIIDALLEADLLRKGKFNGKEFIFRAPHKEWGALRNWIPKPVGE